MRKKGGIFYDEKKRNEMIRRFKRGEKMFRLAKAYHCCIDSIRYWVRPNIRRYLMRKKGLSGEKLKNFWFIKRKGFCRRCGIKLNGPYGGKSDGAHCEECLGYVDKKI
jgi:hypothetical protein